MQARLSSALRDKISSLDIREPYVWRLKLSETDFKELAACLSAFIADRGKSALVTTDNAIYGVVYLAEWYKRKYQSGNKCDLMDSERKDNLTEWLSGHYPQAENLAISAKTGDGMEALAQALMQKTASMRRPEIGYGGEAFMAAMGKISEFYLQYHAAVCCNDFDGNSYLMELAKELQKCFLEEGQEIPHFKFLAWTPEGDFGKVDLLGTERAIEVNHRFQHPCTEMAVILNASAVCAEKNLTRIAMDTVRKVSDRYQLELVTFKQECFGMGA